MFYVTAQVKSGAGDELLAKDCAGHNLVSAMLVAQTWGTARLRELDDPDGYIQYTATQSKSDE